jgi:glycolate oxidase
VITGLAERTFFSTDIASRGETTLAVVQPATSEEVARVVAACTAQGLAVIPRGGGFSYTGGYTPVEAQSVTIDMRRMNRVIEINDVDMYVRVEAGCTWHTLFETLKARGLRTPYYGPMSGYGATIGGAISQGSFFLGSTEYGTTAETVLSLEVVLANGDIIHTASDSKPGVAPFYRNYGPDITGLFLADTGAMGFKTVATLKLIRFPPHHAYGSFAFDNGDQAIAALSEIGRAGLSAAAYAWDPYFVKIMSEATTGVRQDLKFLFEIVRNSAGLVDGLSAGLRIAMNGKRVFKPGTHIVQIMIDDHSQAGAAARLQQVRAIARGHGADELAPSVPRAVAAMPFTNFNIPERRTTLRNLPTNSLYPHSRAGAALTAIRALFAEHQAEIDRLEINIGIVLFAVGKTAMCIEPLFYWHDEQYFQNNRVTETTDIAAMSTIPAPPDATAFAFALREKLKTVMKDNGAVHVQIAKAYDYLPSREPRVAMIVRDIKASVDPQRRINPGSLGL